MLTWSLDEALELVGAHQEVEVGAGDGARPRLLCLHTELGGLAHLLPRLLHPRPALSCRRLIAILDTNCRSRNSCASCGTKLPWPRQQLWAGVLGVGELLLHLLLELLDLLLKLLFLLKDLLDTLLQLLLLVMWRGLLS